MAGPVPPPRNTHSATLLADGQRVFIFGGRDQYTFFNDCWVLNICRFNEDVLSSYYAWSVVNMCMVYSKHEMDWVASFGPQAIWPIRTYWCPSSWQLCNDFWRLERPTWQTRWFVGIQCGYVSMRLQVKIWQMPTVFTFCLRACRYSSVEGAPSHWWKALPTIWPHFLSYFPWCYGMNNSFHLGGHMVSFSSILTSLSYPFFLYLDGLWWMERAQF